MRRFFEGVNWVLILGIVAFALWAWPQLPEKIPTHFGIDGSADAWSPRTFGSWFGVPGMGLLIVLGIGWFRAMIPRKPNWVNLPDKTSLADLPKVAREPVVEMFSGFLAIIQTEVLVIFALIQLSTYRTAMGEKSQGLMIMVLLIAILASPFLVVVFFLGLQKAMDKGKELAAEVTPELL
jgi:uncharacterized membrane protein